MWGDEELCFTHLTEDFRASALLMPQLPKSWFNLGVCHVEAGQLEEAIVSFNTALRVDPDHLGALTKRAAVFLEQGNSLREQILKSVGLLEGQLTEAKRELQDRCNAESGEREVSGLFSMTQIKKQLGMDAGVDIQAAHSFAEIVQTMG